MKFLKFMKLSGGELVDMIYLYYHHGEVLLNKQIFLKIFPFYFMA